MPEKHKYLNTELRLIANMISPFLPEKSSTAGNDITHINSEKLFSLLKFHRLYPFFYKVWQEKQKDTSPSEWSDFSNNLKKVAEQNRIGMLAKAATLIRISNLFQKEEIPLIALKGPALAYRLYGDITLKASSDLDILIPEEYLNNAVAMLMANGFHNLSASIPLTPRQLKYARNNFHHFVFTENDRTTKIELHWRAAHLEHLTGLHSNAFWETPASAVNLGNTPIRIPPPEIEMIYLAAHGAEHGFKRLHWLYDVMMFNQKYPGLIESSSLVKKHEKLVNTTLNCAGVVFNAPVEKGSTHDMYIKLFVRNLSKQQHFSLARLKWHEFVIRWLLVKGFIKKLKIFTIQATSPRDWETLKLPDRLFFLYFILRPFLFMYRRTAVKLRTAMRLRQKPLKGPKGGLTFQ